MDESSDHARELVARYRRARTMDADARARVHQRLLVSTDVAPARVIAMPRRRILAVAALAIATAAAVILAARHLWGPTHATVERPRDADSAVFGQRDDAPQRSVPRPAEPPASIPSDSIETDTIEATPSTTTPRPTPRNATGLDIPAPDTSTHAGTHDPVLAAELALVGGARRALEAGDAELALRRLAEHAREFSDGQLAEERHALRVEALCAAGKRPQARAEATLFRRRYPGSTHAERIARGCPIAP